MINLRLPNIKGKSDKEQINEIRLYLYQLAGDLQVALNAINAKIAELEDKK